MNYGMLPQDKAYKEIVHEILANGHWDTGENVRTVYADGQPAYTKSIFGHQVTFPKGVDPILTSKYVGAKTAFKEIYLFWVLQTTKAEDFEKLNVPIWREWYKEIDGELGIGRSYGYQLRKTNQVEELLYNLKHKPMSRRHLVSYWNRDDIDKKSLQECAWAMQFNVIKNENNNPELEMMLIQRSVDVGLGLSYNWAQYKSLQKMIAYHLGYEVGKFVHQMGNVHYYDRHEDNLLEQVLDYSLEKPEIYLPKKDFFEYTPDDIEVLNYNVTKKVKYEVAI